MLPAVTVYWRTERYWSRSAFASFSRTAPRFIVSSVTAALRSRAAGAGADRIRASRLRAENRERLAAGGRETRAVVRAGRLAGDAAAVVRAGVCAPPGPVARSGRGGLHDDRAVHVRMRLADVADRAGLGEGRRAALALAEDAGVERAVLGGRGVHGRAVVRPRDRVALVHGDRVRSELEVGDRDRRGRRGLGGRVVLLRLRLLLSLGGLGLWLLLRLRFLFRAGSAAGSSGVSAATGGASTGSSGTSGVASSTAPVGSSSSSAASQAGAIRKTTIA